MPGFHDFRAKAGELAQSAARGTRRMADAARINLSITQEQEKIKKAYAELGKLYYRDFETQIAPEGTDYLLWVGKINEAKARIEAARLELEQLRSGPAAAAKAAPVQAPDPAPAAPADIQVVVVDDQAGEDAPNPDE